ncbi:MAG: hypothetical protein IPI55_17285 [Flavobacteriales bacterium]|nr:hypothetical protein [Flavobacteriales bacterium]
MRALLSCMASFPFYRIADRSTVSYVCCPLPPDTSRLTALTGIVKARLHRSIVRWSSWAEFTVLAERGGTTLHKAKAHNLAGMCYSVKSEYGTALPHYQAALDGFEKPRDDWYMAMLHNNIGSVHKGEHRMGMAEQGDRPLRSPGSPNCRTRCGPPVG